MKTKTKETKKTEPVTLNKRPSAFLAEGEKPTEEEILKDVLSIKALRRNMLRSTMAENPYKEKLEKYKSMIHSKEFKEEIDNLLEQFQIGITAEGTKHTFEEVHKKEGQ